MKTSKIEVRNGNPILCIGDEALSACAYMTYFDERNDYRAFAEKGFRIFSVSVFLASQPINTASGFMPYVGGVFDEKGKADFSVVDEAIDKILKSCPNAYIFPRIYVCMPQWWIVENPTETVPVPHDQRRESLYSDTFRKDAADMLRTLIRHFQTFRASDHIFGYQISGGNTQEWFHLDLNVSYDEGALPYFNRYLQKKYPGMEPVSKLPSLDVIKTAVRIEDGLLTEYLRFASEEVAETVMYLCRVVKEAVKGQQIAGVFSGYTAEGPDPLWGTHALGKLLESPDIDFISSPNSYMDGRALGVDWPDMVPADSVKLHGKMIFMECDIRTFLTRSPEESRKGSDPLHYYNDKVWEGPATEELSVWAVRKSLARQLTYKNGLWWFDMFGHWFQTARLMREMEQSRLLYEGTKTGQAADFVTEVMLVYEEEWYAKNGRAHAAHGKAYHLRKTLGMCGVPYETYLLPDLDVIDWKNSPCKAVIFAMPADSEAAARKMEELMQRGIGCMAVTAEKPTFTAAEIRAFLQENSVFVYTADDDVFYIGNGYAALHAATAGEKQICFPKKVTCTDTENGSVFVTDTLTFSCMQYETKLFKIEQS